MVTLDLPAIQGNILQGYPRFPHARFLFLRVSDAADGRRFVGEILPRIAPATKWQVRPEAATQIAFSWEGLAALGLPAACLDSFPTEFEAGMRSRAAALGDTGESAPEHWDEPWQSRRVHILLMVYAQDSEALEARCRQLLFARPDGVEELSPHQDAGQLVVGGQTVGEEHFGFVDGLSNPDVEGAPAGAAGRIGNPDGHGGFHPVAAGEFLLGYPDEGREVPPLPVPHLLTRNGTYLVVRKLAQHVRLFREYLTQQVTLLRGVIPGLTADDIAAKMVGRWRDGSALIRHPTRPAAADPSNDFGYADDPEGEFCPLGAHVRRTNPRDSLGFAGKLSFRRRMIRRGIPYGNHLPEGAIDDGKPRGLMFLAFNASIERQFEFVQQQWINFGDDFRQGNDMDPLVGAHNGRGRMVIPGDERDGRPPLLCTGIPRFVTVKGGDYFFVPSLTGLALVARGQVRAE